MGRPKGNGLVELIDDNADRGRGFFCMDLVSLMWNDEAVRGWEEWHARFEQARRGECPYRDRCQRYRRTMEKQGRRPVQLNLFGKKNTDMKKIMFNDRYGLTEAVLSGCKTMTRRIIKAPKRINGYDTYGFIVCQDIATHEVTGIYVRGYDGGTIDDIEILPKYEIGEVVAVAQSYRDVLAEGFESDAAVLRAFEQRRLVGWTNKMFVRPELMPHRIRITGIGVERLQDISDEDCLREGIRYIPEIDCYYFECTDREEGFYFSSPRAAFADLIDRVSGRGTWDRNPYVVAYEFELLR